MSSLTDVISRVQKLMRVAESSDKPGEVAAAQSLAQELITKHQIEEAQLHGHVKDEEIICKRIETPSPYSIDKSVLLNGIVKYNFCKALRGDKYCLIYGYASDVEICVALYELLVVDMVSSMKVRLAKVKDSDQFESSYTKAWVKSFFSGYAVSIMERIRDSKNKVIKEEEKKGTSVELVLLDKQQAIEDFYQTLPRAPGHKRKLTSKSGYESGVDSGKEANLMQGSIEE